MCVLGEGILELPIIHDMSKKLIRVLVDEPPYSQILSVWVRPKKSRTTSVTLFLKILENLIKEEGFLAGSSTQTS